MQRPNSPRCRSADKPSSKRGQTLVEYALILAIISVVAIGTFAQLGAVIVTVFSSINSVLDTAASTH